MKYLKMFLAGICEIYVHPKLTSSSSDNTAVIAATEKISPNLPATVDGSILREESAAGAFPGFTIDGPFGYDVAIDQVAAKIKGLDKSHVAGAADLLLFPNIEAANAVAKSWKFHGSAETGSLILGAKVPILLNSRSDAASRRINALALAMVVMSNQRRQ